MLQADNSSASSLRSKGTVSLSAVHPDHTTINKQNTNNGNAQRNIGYLFAAFNKAKRSIHVSTGRHRVIHVMHFAQNDEDLYTKDTYSQPETVENYESVVLLVLIHGVGGSSKMWDPQINYFISQGYEILAIDLLGHGLSAKPRDYNAYEFKDLASDVLHVFDKFCKRRNVLIGHSYGSSFCTLLSKERSNKICKTVLISGGGPTMLMPDRCSAFCLPLPMFVCIRSTLVKVFRRMAFHVDTSETVRNKISTFEISSFALKAIMQGQNWFDANEEYHASLNIPVLLIYGRGDQFVTLEEEQWMKETIYGAELEVIDGSGHMVMLEAPTRVNELIHKFLNRDSSTWSNAPNQQKPEVSEERPPTDMETQSPSQSGFFVNSPLSLRSAAGASRMSRYSLRSLRSKTML